MVTILDVAKYILIKQGTISTWKLQKLCYYCQAWALAWNDNKPLFNEDFQAWSNGPVCRELYDLHKDLYSINLQGLPVGNADALNADEKNIVNTVLEYYGDKEPFWLREQAHDEPPWKDARGNIPENERSENIITKQSMGVYYGSL